VAVIVVVHQVLRDIGEHLSRCRRATSRPFDAAFLARGAEEIVPRELSRIARDVEALGKGGEHELADSPAVPAFAKLRKLRDARGILRHGLEDRPLHGELADGALEDGADGLTSGSEKRITRSARDRNALSTASMKFVVVTKSTEGSFFAISSIPRSTASVARCTSTGFASKDAAERLTAKLSTSSMSTTGTGPRGDLGNRLREQARHVALARPTCRSGTRAG
jgi:hypothetical protein